MTGKESFSEIELQAQIIAIANLLKKYNIPLNEWGTGKAKTIKHLAKEIIEGESILIESNGAITRQVEVVFISISCRVGDKKYRLVEDRQAFADGRVRNRDFAGIGEKMKPGEDPQKSAMRAIAEELGIAAPSTIENLGVEEKLMTSPSYPGLTSRYRTHAMLANVPESDFKPEGYIEVQDDKTTFFVWEEVTTDGNI